MSSTVPEGRLEAARRVAQLLATEDGRQQLSMSSRSTQRVIVPTVWDEPIGDVMRRVQEHAPPAVIAILRGDELLLMHVRPARRGVRGSDDASVRSPIGMLYQAVESGGRRQQTFRITEWESLRAERLAVA